MVSDQHEEQRAELLQQRARQDEIDHIIARYMDAFHRGEAPRIAEYMQRYPQYASELLDFATYYLTIGYETESLAGPPETTLSPAAEKAMAQIREQSAVYAPAAVTSLVAQGIELGIAPPDLAETVGLSDELLARLDERIIAAATVPRTLLQRLATALKTAPEAIAAALASAVAGQAPGFYYAETPPEQQQQSFIDAVQGDSTLSPERKREWAEIVHADLEDAQDSGPNP